MLTPSEIDVRSRAHEDADGLAEDVAQLLQLNTVDLLVNRLWWARRRAQAEDNWDALALEEVLHWPKCIVAPALAALCRAIVQRDVV